MKKFIKKAVDVLMFCLGVKGTQTERDAIRDGLIKRG